MRDDIETHGQRDFAKYKLPHGMYLTYITTDTTLSDLKKCPEDDTLYFKKDDEYYIYTVVQGGYTYQFQVYKGEYASSDLVEPLVAHVASKAKFKKEQPNPTTKPKQTEPPTAKPM